MSLSEINKREKDFHNKLHLSEELKKERNRESFIRHCMDCIAIF